MRKVKFSLAVALVVTAMAVVGLAQQSNTFKVKHSPDKVKQSANSPIKTTSAQKTASSANAQALKAAERQAAAKPASAAKKGSASSETAGKKSAPALTPAKEKANPSMNFNGNPSAKKPGLATQRADPLKGRLHTRRE